ncbi:MAG: hypothetical protein ACR2RF_25560 [Geminicoccaceae bacterium]
MPKGSEEKRKKMVLGGMDPIPPLRPFGAVGGRQTVRQRRIRKATEKAMTSSKTGAGAQEVLSMGRKKAGELRMRDIKRGFRKLK